ncbi:MAG: 4-hydroxybenzoate solanesyltransferase [Leptolyngbya sp. SIO4C1]|nr:4-hydroxybenzoate solanesyltransferase [Leptolyngbya sp. SIO4C1]
MVELPPDPRPEPTWMTVLRLMRWDKPAGRLILMIPALWALFLAAQGQPPLPLLGVIVLGSLATSAAGCVVNDLWDRNIDPKVKRTRNRPLASRALSVRVGLVVAVVAFFCAWVLATYLTLLSFWLCVLAVPVIVLYPLAKRVFPVPQLVLAIAWGFAVLITWSAVTGDLSTPTWLLWAATVLWTLGFDTVYAIPDRDYDRQLRVKSSALFFGRGTPQAVGLFFMGTAICLLWLGINMALGLPFWLTWLVAIGFWVVHYRRLKRHHQPPRVYAQIFRQNVWVGFILLTGMVAGVLL